jgi:predicted  nucleic acid-binding Zn-ribbon protein
MTPFEKWTIAFGILGALGAIVTGIWKILREFNKSVDDRITAAISSAVAAITSLLQRHTETEEIRLQQIEGATRETRDDVKDVRERLITIEAKMDAMETERLYRHERERTEK